MLRRIGYAAFMIITATNTAFATESARPLPRYHADRHHQPITDVSRVVQEQQSHPAMKLQSAGAVSGRIYHGGPKSPY